MRANAKKLNAALQVLVAQLRDTNSSLTLRYPKKLISLTKIKSEMLPHALSR